MNILQRMILAVAFIVISAMAVLPPWVYVHDAPRYKRIERPAGYHLISGDHTPQDITQLARLFGLEIGEYETQLQFFAIRLDGKRLLVQVSLTLLLTLILFFVLKTKS